MQHATLVSLVALWVSMAKAIESGVDSVAAVEENGAPIFSEVFFSAERQQEFLEQQRAAAEGDNIIAWKPEWDDPKFPWKVEPGFFRSQQCALHNCVKRPLNAPQLRYCAAASITRRAGTSFNDLVECGGRSTMDECWNTPTSSNGVCAWNFGFDIIPDSCAAALLFAMPWLETGLYQPSIDVAVAEGYAQQPLPTEHAIYSCMQYSRGSADDCNSKMDSDGNPCHMCEQIPGVNYPFIDAPYVPGTNDQFQQWCLADNNFPTFCAMIKGSTGDSCPGWEDNDGLPSGGVTAPKGNSATGTAAAALAAAAAALAVAAVL